MALQLKHRICVTCDAIQFIDWTRPYDAVDNSGGYGTPNPAFSDLTPYSVAVTLPNQTTPIFTLDLLADPPAANADGDYVWEIAAGDLGLTVFTSGNYEFHIIAGDTGNVNGGVPIVSTLYSYLTGDIRKRVWEKIVGEWACATLARKRELMDLYDRVKAARDASCCGYDQLAQTETDALYAEIRLCC
jgi:hypothetical protein